MPVGVFLVAHIWTDRAEWGDEACSHRRYCRCLTDNSRNWYPRCPEQWGHILFPEKTVPFFSIPNPTLGYRNKKSVTGLYQYVIFCGIFTFVCLKWSDEWKTQSCFFWRQRLMLNQHHLPPEKRVNHNHVVLMRFFFRYYPYFFMNSYLLYLSITLLSLQQGSKVKRRPNVQSCLFEWLKSASP